MTALGRERERAMKVGEESIQKRKEQKRGDGLLREGRNRQGKRVNCEQNEESRGARNRQGRRKRKDGN